MAVIIRHYDNPASAREGVETLKLHGIPEQQMGFLTQAGTSGHFQAPEELSDDISGLEGATVGTLAGMVTAAVAMATPIGPLVAAGPLLGTLIGALAGAATGGTVASLVHSGVDEELAQRLVATLENENSVILSVEVPNEEESTVRNLLARTDELHHEEVHHVEVLHSDSRLTADEYRAAYEFGYRTAALDSRPFDYAEGDLRRDYPGDFARDAVAIQAGYNRYRDTVQVIEDE